MNEEEIVKKILNKIKSKEDDKVLKKVEDVLKSIDEELIRRNIKAKCFLGGSLAKGTYLPDDYDADVFVRFDYSVYADKNNELSDFLEQALEKFKPKRVHGSRDYFQFKRKGINFEVVPVLNINSIEEAKNITDISPLHVLWFRNKANEKIIDSVRLSKLFCKANEVYGAESFVRGFSGHVLDILNVHYKSFLRFIREAASWDDKIRRGEKIVVDVENFHKGKALFNLNKSKTTGPLIVIDPIQKDRNAAAALSEEKLLKFIDSAKRFLKKPSEKFFEEKKFSEKDAVGKARKKDAVIVVNLTPKTRKSIDVLGCKLLKAYNTIKKHIEEEDFSIRWEKFSWEKKENKEAVCVFIIKNPIIKEPKIIVGPPSDMKDAANNFKKKHRRTKIHKGRVIAIEKRRFKRIDDLVKTIIQSGELKDKIRGASFKIIKVQ